MRDHGGDLDKAKERFGAGAWLDLSTGINLCPYPITTVNTRSWVALPTQTDMVALKYAASQAYKMHSATDSIVPCAGAQAAIQLLPALLRQNGIAGEVRVISPTYNEHAAVFSDAGWQIAEVSDLKALSGASIAIVVNPNNPDGRFYRAFELLSLLNQVGFLIVDESFIDATPEHSIIPMLRNLAPQQARKVVALRSFGKFYGLAGLRLGFAITTDKVLFAQLKAAVGPWPISGLAIEVGQKALVDHHWQQKTRDRLAADIMRLDHLAKKAGWHLVGGSALFRTYDTNEISPATEQQKKLAQAYIWSRIFPYASGWLRLGLPSDKTSWQRLETAILSRDR